MTMAALSFHPTAWANQPTAQQHLFLGFSSTQRSAVTDPTPNPTAQQAKTEPFYKRWGQTLGKLWKTVTSPFRPKIKEQIVEAGHQLLDRVKTEIPQVSQTLLNNVEERLPKITKQAVQIVEEAVPQTAKKLIQCIRKPLRQEIGKIVDENVGKLRFASSTVANTAGSSFSKGLLLGFLKGFKNSLVVSLQKLKPSSAGYSNL